MKNKIEIHTDGVNVYTTLSVKTGVFGKIVLIVFIVFIFVFMVVAASFTDKKESGTLIIALLIMFILVMAFPVRILIWNIYGKEMLIVNSKTISYNYDYGIIRTKLKTVHFDRLGTGIETVRKEEGTEEGRLILYNYREADSLPEVIHETTIVVETDHLQELKLAILAIFDDETQRMSGSLCYSMN